MLLLHLTFGDRKGCTAKRRTFFLVAFTVAYLGIRDTKSLAGGGDLSSRFFGSDSSDEARDRKYIEEIRSFSPSSEKRVISFSLYGDDPKYTSGAIRNAELRDVYFPGWTTRYYVDDTVPAEIIDRLAALGAEVLKKKGRGEGSGGMFWRFHVADDPAVDRFIVRDVDSRLNARDRFAVEEWIASGKAVHIIRDHLCHSYRMNGGLWGARRGFLQGASMHELMGRWNHSKKEYIADMDFLGEVVWPRVAEDHLAHDAYTCTQYDPEQATSFPTQRPTSFQHVGQVFDADGRPVFNHISGYTCGGVMMYTLVSEPCRRHPNWIFG